MCGEQGLNLTRTRQCRPETENRKKRRTGGEGEAKEAMKKRDRGGKVRTAGLRKRV